MKALVLCNRGFGTTMISGCGALVLDSKGTRIANLSLDLIAYWQNS